MGFTRREGYRGTKSRRKSNIFIYLYVFFNVSLTLYFFSLALLLRSPLSVDELVFQITQRLPSLYDCPTEAIFMDYKFYREICLRG